MTAEERADVATLAGQPLKSLTQKILTIADPDVLADLERSAPKGKDGKPDVAAAIRAHIEAIVTPLAGNPKLRERLIQIRASHDRVIDEVSVDTLVTAHGVVDLSKCRDVVASWRKFIEDNKDEITLIQVLYSQPKDAKITFQELKEVSNAIAAPPRSWSIDLIWNAYMALEADKVKKAGRHTATDLITLIRYTLELDSKLVPFALTVEEKYTNWLAQQAQKGVAFTDTQRWWLDRIRDTIIQNASVTTEDLELAPFTERGGIDGAGRDLGDAAATLMAELNVVLAA
jgi:type I restriction enzyme R subunit